MNRAAEPGSEPLDHALGRSRGSLSIKIHQLADGNGRPLVIALTAGQAGDSPMLKWLLADLAVNRSGRGVPHSTHCPCSRQGLLLARWGHLRQTRSA
jgi:hypothetical protein